MDRIQHNWEALQERVQAAARRGGRDADAVTIVAVTKTRTVEEVEAAIAAGVTDVGENRVQEAEDKRGRVTGSARWHLVGQLQRNKAGRALDTFDMVQSVDSERLATALAGRAERAGRAIDVLLQVNTAGVSQQGGIDPEALPALAAVAAPLQHLRVRGLMTIAAHDPDESRVRACFAGLRACAEQLRRGGPEGIGTEVLSMGMSGDFELAVEEGATLVRVGTAIFGPRP